MFTGYHSSALIYESDRTHVYRAVRDADQQSVILKTPAQAYPSQAELARYQQEHALLSKVASSGVIRTYGMERYKNGLMLILEDCGGLSLKQILQERSVSLIEVLIVGIQIAEQLHHIHDARVVHKDINPANILLMPTSQQVRLIDFGLATEVAHELIPDGQDLRLLVGTLPYLAPEQTGRVNHYVDYRADFYALGITLYELLTQQLPFEGHDLLELVHCHIAKTPPTPTEIDDQIPEMVSQLVMKLIAKDPDDRYQSAWGLRQDLQACLTQWKTAEKITSFELAAKDIPQQFSLSQKLYGRELAQSILQTAYADSCQGQTVLTLISGSSGMGKSTMIQSIKSSIYQQNGHFLAGKFEQLQQQQRPYRALSMALSHWVEHILTLPETQFQQWRDRLAIALGPNGGLMVDFIPVLDTLMGPQPRLPDLPPTESVQRFEWVFLSFMRVLCQAEHPLVLCLDDLQWADPGTFKLIDLMRQDPELQYLLLIGAYRPLDKTSEAPLNAWLNRLVETPSDFRPIGLQPLAVDHITQLIVDSFGCEPARALPLAALIQQKTSGYPFFVNQFLRSLYQAGLLTRPGMVLDALNPDPEMPTWQWDIETIQRCKITENVASLVVQQLNEVPDSTQRILRWAACLGSQFELSDLSALLSKTQVTLYRDLRPAIEANLIVPAAAMTLVDEGNATEELLSTSSSGLIISTFKFIHDQVQGAVLAQLDESEAQSIHLHIGRWLKTCYQSAIPNPEQHFQWVNHFNLGQALIDEADEKCYLAQLNLVAGKNAMATTAYTSACSYFSLGLRNLALSAWSEDYDLIFALTYHWAEAEQRRGDFEASEALIQTLLAKTVSAVDKAQVYHLLILQYTLQSRYEDALAVGKEALALLGVEIPGADLERVVEDQLTEFRTHLGDRPVESLLENTPITCETTCASVKILGTLQPTAYRTNTQLFMWVVTKLINLAIQYGDAPEVCYAYGAYGILLSGVWGEYALGQEFGQMSLQLSRKLNNPMQECKACMVLGSFLNHWLKPLHTTEAIYHDGYHAGLFSGELQYVGYSLSYQSYHFFYQGQLLENVLDTIPDYLSFTQKSQNYWATDALLGAERIILNLLGQTDSPANFDLERSAEQDYLDRAEDRQSFNPLARYHILKAYVLYLYGEYERALTCVRSAQALLDYVAATIAIPEYTFIAALTLAALSDQVDADLKEAYWEEITQYQAQLQGWSQHCAANFEHKSLLVSAELARLSDQPWQAMSLYDQAIASAHHYSCLPNEALAKERAADFWQSQQKCEFADLFRTGAYALYQRWGAIQKVSQMEVQFPALKTGSLSNVSTSTSLSVVPSLSSRSYYSDKILDVETVIKASQSLSSEIVLSDLLSTLLTIAMENAGAQAGVLLLEHDHQLLIEVTHHHPCQVTDQRMAVLDAEQSLPITLIQYVARTQKPLLIENAVESTQFSQDAYIQQYQPKSICCMPIVHQAQLVGMLYLENNLISQAFTLQHVDILKILAAQAAISIQNSSLFDTLEQAKQALELSNQDLEKKVQARTQALADKNLVLLKAMDKLQQTQLQLIQTEKMSSLGQMVAGIAHEINNPVSFIYGNLEPAQEYTQDLLTLIEQYQRHYPNPVATVAELSRKIDLPFIQSDLPELLKSMEMGAERITDIVTSLRNFSRLDESAQKQVNIHEGIESTLVILHNRLREGATHDAIEVTKSFGELPLISCYTSQLNQVFMNILSNAVDALRDRSGDSSAIGPNPKIHIQTSVAGDHCMIQISDNGPGMPEAVREKIFDPFFTTKPVGSGTGLGLSISHQIVTQQHHGTLNCESSPHQGTKFIITLPLVPEAQALSDEDA